MAKEKAPTVLIRAQHVSRKDRKGSPLEKIFTLDAWQALHDDNWTQVSSSHPVAKPAQVKAKAPSTAKKLTAKKPAAKAPKALKAKAKK